MAMATMETMAMATTTEDTTTTATITKVQQLFQDQMEPTTKAMHNNAQKVALYMEGVVLKMSAP